MPAAVRRSLGEGGWPVWLGAAAALLLATVIGVVPWIERQREHTDNDRASDAAPADVTVESITVEFEAAETHYQKAIDELQTIANAETGELDTRRSPRCCRRT